MPPSSPPLRRGLALALPRLLLLLCLAFASAPLRAVTEVGYPDDAPVWNVKDYGAIGNGVADDTPAFKAAISAALNGPAPYSAICIIYVPNGVYRLTDTLQNRVLPDGSWDVQDRWRAGFHLQGESRAGTILKLADNATGFTDPARPRPVIQTGSENPQVKPAPRVTSLTRSGTTATAVSAAHGLVSGMQVRITGASQAAYNGVFAVNVINADTFSFQVAGSPATPATGTVRFSRLVASITRSGTTATVLYPNHGFTTGAQVIVSGAVQTAYNGGKYATVVNADTFTFPVSGSPATPATGTITLGGYKDGEFNEAFRHYIRNLTVDVGAGNPGAIGIDLIVHNRGGVFDVTVRSGDVNRVGHTGIAMNREWPGPGLIKNVTVSGFETGVSMLYHAQYGMTLEHVSLEHQRTVGIVVEKNTLTARGLRSVNTVPAVSVTGAAAHLTLIDADFSGGSPANNAITSAGKTFLRNLVSAGYGMVVQDLGPNNRDVAGGGSTTHVDEYLSHGAYKEYVDAIGGSMHLPVEETPDFTTNDFARWRSVTTTSNGIPGATPDNAADDDLPGIQNALEQGREVVYLPRGAYSISNTILVSGPVRRIVGLCAGIKKLPNFPAGQPLIRFTGAGADFTTLQYLRLVGDIEHDSARALAIVNSDFEHYTNTAAGTGRVFFEDMIGYTVTLAHPQPAWARQLNLEIQGSAFTGSFVVNEGGRFWILGYKTEGFNPTLLTNRGGWVELWGGYFLPNVGNPTAPMLVNEDGWISANYKVGELSGTNYATQVVDVRGATTQTFLSSEVADGRNCTLYSGTTAKYPANGYVLVGNAGANGHVIADAVRYQRVVSPEIIVDNSAGAPRVTTSGTWAASTTNPGYLGSNYLHDGNAGQGARFVRYTPDLPATSAYEVFVRWTADANRASNAPVQIHHAGGSVVKTISGPTAVRGFRWACIDSSEARPVMSRSATPTPTAS